jgi:hypothetical protein
LIAGQWGEEVARIVDELTDDKKLPKDERKRKQIDSAAHKSSKAKVIKLADATSNLRAITASPSPDWSVKRRLEYVWARSVVEGLRGTNICEMDKRIAGLLTNFPTIFEKRRRTQCTLS